MSLQGTPTKRYETYRHPLLRTSESSDEEAELPCKEVIGSSSRSRSEDSSKAGQHCKNLRVVDGSQKKLTTVNCSLFDRLTYRLWASFGHYNSVLHQALALSPFRRHRAVKKTQSESCTREGNYLYSDLVAERRNIIELSQVVGILKKRSASQDSGHDFVSVIMSKATWCDHCGKYILGYYHHCLQCPICLFTCHVTCRNQVALKCPSLQLDEILGISRKLLYETTVNSRPRLGVSMSHDNSNKEDNKSKGRTISVNLDPKCARVEELEETSSISSCESQEEFEQRIHSFNDNRFGLSLKLMPNSLEGSIRVHMNLFRPITCISAPPPTSSDDESVQLSCTYKTSFHLPRDASKLVHINDNTTTEEVIEILLKKFCIANNPKSFALYHKSIIHDNVHTMRKLNPNELPLVLCLHWFYQGPEALDSNRFILQEIDPGDILWESFSVPELDNFLMMLNKEEEEHETRITEKFRIMKLHMERLMKEMCQDPKNPVKAKTVLDVL